MLLVSVSLLAADPPPSWLIVEATAGRGDAA
jgi:hypothetical protein